MESLRFDQKSTILFDYNPAPMIMFEGESLKIIDINQAAIEKYGYSKDEFLSLTVMHLDVDSRTPKYVNTASYNLHGYNDWGTCVHRRKNGSAFYVHVIVQSILSVGRNLKLALLQDVPDKVRDDVVAMRAYNQLKYHIINSPLAVLEWDGKLKLRAWSEKAQNIFGYDSSEVLGKSILELFPFMVSEADWILIKDQIQILKKSNQNSTQFKICILTADENIRYTKWNNSALRSDNGDLISILSFVEDVTDQHEAQEALAYSQRLYKSLFDHALDAILLADSRTHYVDANEAACRMLGYTQEEMKNLNLIEITPEGRIDIARRTWGAFQNRGYGKGEFKLRRKDGKIIDVEYRAVANIVEGVHLAVLQDITDQKHSKKELLEEKHFTDTIINSLPGMFFVTDENGRLLRWNKNTEKILGYSAEELPEVEPLDFYAEEDREEAARKIQKIITEGQSSAELRVLTKNGNHIPSFINASCSVSGGKKYIVGMSIDISKRKEAEKKVLKSLREKEVLLAEMHHRVKNNLAVISSLLDLQREITDAQNARESLYYSQARIHSIAMIHEMLYQDEDLSRVKFDDYVHRLTEYIFKAFKRDNDDDNYDIEASEVYVNINQGIPLGLILNELLNNAIKHGSCNMCDSSRIHIELKQKGSNCQLSVRDHGQGLPASFNISKSDTLGLRLIRVLTNQLKGAVDYHYENGAVFTVSFELA